MTEELGYDLRRPCNDDEWRAYHAIRREVLFENRGYFGIYDETLEPFCAGRGIARFCAHEPP